MNWNPEHLQSTQNCSWKKLLAEKPGHVAT